MLIRITNLLVGVGIFKDLGKGVFALSWDQPIHANSRTDSVENCAEPAD